METQVVNSNGKSTFKSPLRILVRSFQRSRDNWKQKYMAIKAEIKRYKNQAADARRSREKWKVQAQAFEAQNRRLESELAELQVGQEAPDAKKKPRPR